ncbi:hypothetical protein BJ742DRAFT_768561 [Cladochytrium replicatum]|nr:hypothetical protein BJ742DRAFT_768561 [Cladochytrium replicatum]
MSAVSSTTAPVRNNISALANSETINSLNNLVRSAPVTSQLYSIAQAATGNAKGAYKTQVDFLSSVVDAALFVPMTTVNWSRDRRGMWRSRRGAAGFESAAGSGDCVLDCITLLVQVLFY